MKDSNQELKKQTKKTYIKMIENSVGTRMFNSGYVEMPNGESKDVLNDGELSCAFFVTSLIKIFDLIDQPSATVKTTEEKLTVNGWKQINSSGVQQGNIVVWEEVEFEDGSKNNHIGFVLNQKEAVSTSWIEKKVVRHHITFGIDSEGAPRRKIARVYRWNKF